MKLFRAQSPWDGTTYIAAASMANALAKFRKRSADENKINGCTFSEGAPEYPASIEQVSDEVVS